MKLIRRRPSHSEAVDRARRDPAAENEERKSDPCRTRTRRRRPRVAAGAEWPMPSGWLHRGEPRASGGTAAMQSNDSWRLRFRCVSERDAVVRGGSDRPEPRRVADGHFLRVRSSPRIDRRRLSPSTVLRSAITHHGSLIVREGSLLNGAQVDQDSIRRASITTLAPTFRRRGRRPGARPRRLVPTSSRHDPVSDPSGNEEAIPRLAVPV